ncbi:MAG: DUF4124 domain-containing protein [Methylococcales bacterium]|nr:DUF4124 domain-containing protein [Methylococcales bacterium]
MKRFAAFSVMFVLFFLVAMPLAAEKLYRWQDENGNVYFSDVVPPEHADKRLESLSSTGRVVDVKEKAKTREELAIDWRVRRYQQAQMKLSDRQQRLDRILLTSHASVQELKAVHAVQLDTQMRQIKTAESNVSLLENQLNEQLMAGANLERNGKKVTQALRDAISDTQQQIIKANEALQQRHVEKEQMLAEQEREVKRYIFLTKGAASMWTKPVFMAASQPGLFYCVHDDHCQNAWRAARAFLIRQAAGQTGLEVNRKDLLLMPPPVQADDISLGLARIQLRNGESQILLTLHCLETPAGQVLCNGPKAGQLRERFQSAINQALSSMPANQ